LELTLSDRQAEKTLWTQQLTAGLREIDGGPDEVRVLIGGGVTFLLRKGAERLVVELVHIDAEKHGFQTVGSCVIRYQGQDLGPNMDAWLHAIAATVEQIPGPQVDDWTSYLFWATRQPSRGFGVESGERTSQGTELIVRLLEPCQARCAFCICRSAQPDMVSSADDIEERISSGRVAGFRDVVFTGGEPTLVRELPELLSRARTLRYRRVGVQTNGIKMADMAYAQELVSAGLNSVLQSLHSHEPGVHESIFQIDGCFTDCVRAVQNSMALGLNVCLNYVTTVDNQDGHRDFVRFVHENFGRPNRWRFPHRPRYPSISFSSMSPQGWGANNSSILPRLSSVASSVRLAAELAEELGIFVRIPGLCGFPPCLLPEHALLFDELRDSEPVTIEARQYFDGCDDCAFRGGCSGYWKGYVLHHGTEEFRPALASDGYGIPRRWPWQRR